MIKAVIFDCFGVLVTEAWLPFKAKYFGDDESKFQAASEIARKANAGLIGQQDFIEGIAELAGLTAEETLSAISQNVPDEALFKQIRELKSAYKIGFLSNIAADYLNRMFGREQLDLFDAICLSFENGYVKPQPQAYLAAAEQLDVEPGECILVDDQERNVTGARNTGMQAILYTDAQQFKKDLDKLLA